MFLRSFRFSLRTLLIITMICCIVVALVAERWRRVSQAVARIKSAGGQITYNYQRGIGFLHDQELEQAAAASRRYDWLQNFVFFPERLTIDHDETESQLSAILLDGFRMGTIRKVVVYGDLSDEHALQLSRFPRLEEVEIHSGILTSRGAAQLLQHPRLQSLDLSGCMKVDDSLVPAITRKVPSIYLDLRRTGISPTKLKRFDPNL